MNTTVFLMIASLLASPVLGQDYGEKPDDAHFKISLLTFNAANAANAASTAYVLNRGGRELNSFLPENSGAILAIKAGYSAGFSWMLCKVHKKRPRTAKILAWLGTAVFVGATLHNIGQARKADANRLEPR